MKEIEIYTDGACSGNPGPGGWGAILKYNGREKVLSGGEKETTNNRMELLAVICALEALKEPCQVKLYSDSTYVVNAISQGWLQNWQLNSWRTSGRDSVKNIELWQRLIPLLSKNVVEFIKVKGHSDNVDNNRCDEIARREINKFLG